MIKVFNTASTLSSLQHLSWFVQCLLWLPVIYLIRVTVIIKWESPSFTLKQHWARNLEGVIERPLYDSSPSLRLTPSSCGSLFPAGRMKLFGEKNTLSQCCKIDFRSENKSYLFCMLIYSLLRQKKKNCFLQEVCNKSLAIDDNGICACVCHLRKSNSGGVSTDLFVY